MKDTTKTEDKPKAEELVAPVLTPSKTFIFFWGGIPGVPLRITLSIAFSEDMARERESLATLSIDERNSKHPLYKIKMLADVLEARPEGFPDFPTYEPPPGVESDESAAVEFYQAEFIKYFAQKRAGRMIFQRLMEKLYNDYWDWALPNPIIPASESLLNLLATSIKDSGS